MANPVCITHSDADGYCAASIVRKALGNRVTIMPSNYGRSIAWDKIPNGSSVYILDMCFDNHIMEKFNRDYKLTWIDHHGNAVQQAKLRGFEPAGLRDDTRGACLLTWEYMFPNMKVPNSVKWISDYDTWTFQYPETKQFIAGLNTMQIRPGYQTESFWNLLLDDHPDLIKDIMQRGAEITEFDNLLKDITIKDLYYEVKTRIGDTDRVILAANARGNSTIFDTTVDKSKHDMVMCYAWVGNINAYRYGVYQVEGKSLDVSEFARFNGGDGHVGAAGFTSPKMPKLTTIDSKSIEHVTHMVPGVIEGSKPKDPSYFQPINDFCNRSNLAKTYMFTNEKISLNSQKFFTTLHQWNVIAINHPSPRYELFITQDMMMRDILISYVWTNCGMYRVVVHPLVSCCGIEVRSYLKEQYDLIEINDGSFWFYTKELPFAVGR